MAPVRAGLARQPPIAGAILAGGQSRRFGADKALAPTPTGPLAGRALMALRGAGVDPVVLIGGSPELSAELAIPSIADREPGLGPLAGLSTALNWAAGVSRIVVLPCDMPNVNPSMIRALVAAGDNVTAAIASVEDRPHPILACWPIARAGSIASLVRSGERRLSTALDSGPFVLVTIDPNAAADADSPSELADLLNPPSADLQ